MDADNITEGRPAHPRDQIHKVEFQFRFPPSLSIDAEAAAFQKAVSASFPRYHRCVVPSGFTTIPDAGHHEFTSNDYRWVLRLSIGDLSLVTDAFPGWPGFRAVAEDISRAMDRSFAVGSYTRVGVRTVYAIRPSSLGVGDELRDILRPPFAGALGPALGVPRGGSVMNEYGVSEDDAGRTIVKTIVFGDGERGVSVENVLHTASGTHPWDVMEVADRLWRESLDALRGTVTDLVLRRMLP